jgi:hypothetical protein
MYSISRLILKERLKHVPVHGQVLDKPWTNHGQTMDKHAVSHGQAMDKRWTNPHFE